MDYGIFLNPHPSAAETGTGRDKAAFPPGGKPTSHLMLPDDALMPLAISIETKSLRADSITGPTQLANWVRAHFRHLADIAAVPEKSGQSAEEAGEDSHPVASQVSLPVLPVLPIVFVYGPSWRVDFAQRQGGKTVIYEGVSIGTTKTLPGCYFVRAGLRRLASWADVHYRSWLDDRGLSS